jgi:hypothetical protein
MMKKVLIGAVIVICAALVYKILSFNMFRPGTEVISLGNAKAGELEAILQIRAMQVNETCRIDTVREGTFYDDRLVCSYEGIINIGVDFADTISNWATKSNDGKITLKYPCLKVINADGWVITGSSVQMEKGKWSNQELKELSERANVVLKEQAAKHIAEAEKNLRTQLTAKLNGLGYNDVEISFCNN